MKRKSGSRGRRSRGKEFKFRHELRATVTVRRPEFDFLSTLPYVDQTKLKKGTHKIEVGYLKTTCGNRIVTAVITRGMITAFEVERCTEAKPAPPEFKKLLSVALKKFGTGGKAPLPISFASFAARTIDIGWRLPCAWIIITTDAPGTQQGVVVHCCIKTTKIGPLEDTYLDCGILPYPPLP